MTGIITDIHRTSLVDGPGIRTTVFLKGCPLRCTWCHNPETQCPRVELGFDQEKCVGCGDCAAKCPEAAISFREGKAQVNRAACTDCGKCVPACPSGALFLYGKEVHDEDVLEEVLRDRAYYEASGGGVTLSGGEPMAQPEFALSFLRKCRQAGLHTTLDTTGFMSRRECERTLEFTDLYLFDYKATDDSLHRKLTGVPLAPILEALDFLLSRRAAVILRCPLIPGVNDQEAHLTAIADMEGRYPTLRGIELLPWHTMGKAKYGRLGRKAASNLPAVNVPEATKARYQAFFAARGSTQVKLC